MLVSALILGALALALAWPVPVLLAHARWPGRSPGVALALWQGIALAGGVSMIGSLLSYGLSPFGANLADGLVALWGSLRGGTLSSGVDFVHVLALCGALLLGTHLLLNLAATFLRAEHQRRRHHHLIALLSDPLPNRPGMRVIDYEAPVAYCLPGAARSATVLSNGLLRLLNADQLRGVIEHEQAHLRQQHHLVQLAFKSWHSALPWFPIANRAENAVALLVEMLADDRARRVVDDRTLATAIALVGLGQQPEAPAPVSSSTTGEPVFTSREQALVAPRVHRLMTRTAPLSRLATAGALTTAITLALAPAIVLLQS
ncbi:M56 family metallopeptidase [Cryobacterium psychrophilum]|uniref:M56 family peptidase n=1 Tax=Cryobacterium psychrophilum TaxID=41988 RepID=A0A4Y8KR96_9MICO|nr:M56 family metallopeptidase [Cryobacterium psychrophilum]TDW31516.1 peptidase M48-like protein [Cryobacterium psychrophilum]TFD79331.1 M56 family peptidase [Cryobacterium psychrophilum]